MEYFSWNSWHSQFLGDLVGQLVATDIIILNIFNLCVALRVAYTVDTKVFFQVTIFDNRVGVVVCLVLKLLLQDYFWFSSQVLCLGGASVLVEYGDNLLDLGVIDDLLVVLENSL